MDETTKVIIATLSGFIVAFFAEPVKNYFQNRAKLHNLRLALYKELVNNYFALESFVINRKSDAFKMNHLIKHEMRVECYKHVIQNDVTLFYQLREAGQLNLLYGTLNQLIHLEDDLAMFHGKRAMTLATHDFSQHSNRYKIMFADGFYSGAFGVKILRGLVSSKQYREIMDKGKEENYSRLSENK